VAAHHGPGTSTAATREELMEPHLTTRPDGTGRLP
jgi:hypothetical protein